MHGQSYLAGCIYLLCRQRSLVAWGRASDKTAQGARSDFGLRPLGKVLESGAGGEHAPGELSAVLSGQQQPCSRDGTLTVRNGPTVTAPCRIFPKVLLDDPSFIESLTFLARS